MQCDAMRCNVMYCVCNISLRADVHAYLHAYGLVFVATEICSRKMSFLDPGKRDVDAIR